MTDTTGWKKSDDIVEKYIDSNWFTISDIPRPCSLRMNRAFIAYRPTLRECQLLAHETARLWAGEKP